MEEQWKDVKGYEGIYKISNLSRIKSLYRIEHTLSKNGNKYSRIRPNKILKIITKKNKYQQVTLHKDSKSKVYLFHRLLAQHFLPNTEKKPQVNHKDGNPSNNSLFNLEWCTPSENGKHSYRVLGNKNWCLGRFGKDHPASKLYIPFPSEERLQEEYEINNK